MPIPSAAPPDASAAVIPDLPRYRTSAAFFDPVAQTKTEDPLKAVALLLSDSVSFRSLLKELGADWTFRIREKEIDGYDAVAKLITVKEVRIRLDTRERYKEFTLLDTPATATKVVALIADVLRMRDLETSIEPPGQAETQKAFTERFVEARAAVELAYYARIIGVASDLVGSWFKVNKARNEYFVERKLPLPEPLPSTVIGIASITPGITLKDILGYADRLSLADGGDKGEKGAQARLKVVLTIAKEIAAKPLAKAAFEKQAAEAWAAAKTAPATTPRPAPRPN